MNSDCTVKRNAITRFRHWCALIVHLAQVDREMTDIFVSCKRSEKMIFIWENTLDVLKNMFLLEGLNGFATAIL